MKRALVTLEDLGAAHAIFAAARRAHWRIKRQECATAPDPDSDASWGPPCLVNNRFAAEEEEAYEHGCGGMPIHYRVDPCPRCEALVGASATLRAATRVLNGKAKSYLAQCDRKAKP